jgi:hypothetical protein
VVLWKTTVWLATAPQPRSRRRTPCWCWCSSWRWACCSFPWRINNGHAISLNDGVRVRLKARRETAGEEGDACAM